MGPCHRLHSPMLCPSRPSLLSTVALNDTPPFYDPAASSSLLTLQATFQQGPWHSKKVLGPSLLSSIKRVIIHVGTNYTALQQSELTKSHLNHLFNFLKCCEKSQVPFPRWAAVLVVSTDSLASTAGFSPLVGFMRWVSLTILICFGTVCLFLEETAFTQTNWAYEC